MLCEAVGQLLARIPDTWEEFVHDELSEVQAQALFLLTAAGMVERREEFRIRMVGRRVSVDATITATGEYGLIEALEALASQVWPDWEDAFTKWQQGDAG